MINQWWSVALTLIGITGLFLTMRKSITGPIVGASVQALWIAYAIATMQPAFIASALAYAAVNIYGIIRWARERRERLATASLLAAPKTPEKAREDR